jgi:hypothetical protein
VGIELTRGIHTDLLRHGGPFIALGGTFDRGFRGRVGYELGIGELVLLEVALDSDFQQQVVIAPLIEIASYSLLLLPSLSLGAGVPIQVAPDVRAGVRFEASATFYSLAFVASIDVWPVDGSWQLSLLGRAGL